jgi:Flp pilus assembly protein TadD
MSKAADELSNRMPKDAGLARMLAQEATLARQFGEAARLFQRVMEADPEDTATLNALGYSQFLAGDLAGARKSFQEYGKNPENAGNAADSEGEVLFMAGKFDEAENMFRKAHNLKPTLLEGGDLQKAAYARWLAGDLNGADRAFDEFLKYRLEKKDKVTEWRRGVWYYATGRADKAVETLQKIGGEVAPLAQKQIEFWANTTQIDRPAAVLEPLYRRTLPPNDGLVRVLYARALWRENRETEAAELAKLWPLPPQENDDQDLFLRGFLYPLYQELQRKLPTK